MVRLPVNLGPAGGFRAGLEAAFEDGTTQWAYLCEDDVGLFNLPTPRVSTVLEQLGPACDAATDGVGAVVAYGRRFVGRGHSVNVVPELGAPRFVPVDVAPWGATLVARAAVERGVLPATKWFFGFEDFDFFFRLRAAGLSVLLDTESARRGCTGSDLGGQRGRVLNGPSRRRGRAMARLLLRAQLFPPGPGPRVGELAGVAPGLFGTAPAAGRQQRRTQGDVARSGRRRAWPLGPTPALQQDDGELDPPS